MSLQASAFRLICGDVWHRLNVDDLAPAYDPVSALMEAVGCKPGRLLEIGCGTGWRLKRMQEKYGCKVEGVEPSLEAITQAEVAGIFRGTAEQLLPWPDRHFDTIIYGFCLCFADPVDYFRIVAEGDRLLKDGGNLFIHDRFMPFPVQRRQWGIKIKEEGEKEKDYEVQLRGMDYSKLWLGNPCYREVNKMFNPDTLDAVWALRKSVGDAFLQGTAIPRTDGVTLSEDGFPIYPDKK